MHKLMKHNKYMIVLNDRGAISFSIVTLLIQIKIKIFQIFISYQTFLKKTTQISIDRCAYDQSNQRVWKRRRIES